MGSVYALRQRSACGASSRDPQPRLAGRAIEQDFSAAMRSTLGPARVLLSAISGSLVNGLRSTSEIS